MSLAPLFFNDTIPRIRRLIRSKLELTQPFEQMVRGFSKSTGSVILLSGTSLDCAMYNILAIKPWLTITAKGKNISVCVDNKQLCFSGDPLQFIDELIKHCSIDYNKSLYPVSAGLFGYLAYDLKDRIESLPNSCMDQNLPDLYLCAPSIIFVHDRHNNFVEKIIIETDKDKGIKDIQLDYTQESQVDLESQTFSIDPEGFKSNFSKSEYIEAVEKIVEYIKAGDIYQVNLSQRFSTDFKGDPYSLFLKLFEKNPAPFFSFINAGDHQIISTSPERFIKQNQGIIETRPIKGTMPRGKRGREKENFLDINQNYNKNEDDQLGQALLSSKKDDAELSMIVDLMRNDFGKVAIGGTVKVKEHKRLEPYDNVFHLVSIVEANLEPDKSSIDLIRATFPGGSITGCPKIRSMEIIDELESVRRHVYTGSIGYISFHRTLDLSIAIRTAVVASGKIGFSVGGGIVFDSDPEKEYEETLHKGKTIMDTLVESSDLLNLTLPDIPLSRSDMPLSSPNSFSKFANNREKKPSKVKITSKAWVNGKIIDEKKVVIPVYYTGFQYGAGLFETMRVEKGKILRLQEHLERLSASWQTLFTEDIPHINQIGWQSVIDNLIQLNGLANEPVAVKLMVAQSDTGKDLSKITDSVNIHYPTANPYSCTNSHPSVDGESHFIALFVRPYKHRLKVCGKNGLDLITYPERRHTYLAAHKSLNYLYYYLAGKFAKKRGYDEALILNADGTVSETNTASLISVSESERKVVISQSDYALPSVTLNAALKILAKAGYEIVKTKITLSELILMKNILIINSLMGAVKVLSIDSHKIAHTTISNYSGSKIHISEFGSSNTNRFCDWLNNELLR